MSIRLTKQEIQWVLHEYDTGRTVQEIAVDTGMSANNVKRALAEAGVLNLSWYKTVNENEMLTFLWSVGIHDTLNLKRALGYM